MEVDKSAWEWLACSVTVGDCGTRGGGVAVTAGSEMLRMGDCAGLRNCLCRSSCEWGRLRVDNVRGTVAKGPQIASWNFNVASL